MGSLALPTTSEIYNQANEETPISMVLHPPTDWKQFVDEFIFKRVHLKNDFNEINNLHQNINLTMEEESNGKRALLGTL